MPGVSGERCYDRMVQGYSHVVRAQVDDLGPHPGEAAGIDGLLGPMKRLRAGHANVSKLDTDKAAGALNNENVG